MFTAYKLAYIDQAIQSNSEEDVVSHLLIQSGASGLTLLVDSADLVGDASRRRRTPSRAVPASPSPTFSAQPDPALESAGTAGHLGDQACQRTPLAMGI